VGLVTLRRLVVVRQKTLMTADELLRMPDDDCRHELLDGVLVTMAPTGGSHGRAMVKLSHLLLTFVERNGLGEVLCGDTGITLRRNPDRVRAPDICFIARDRVPAGGIPVGYLEFVPDLVVEILSPTDRPREVEQKVQEWLDSGARLVWVIDPGLETIAVRRAGGEPRVLSGNDALPGEDVLPGFGIAAREVFA
jgi:Uma2 family endonuclease